MLRSFILLRIRPNFAESRFPLLQEGGRDVRPELTMYINDSGTHISLSKKYLMIRNYVLKKWTRKERGRESIAGKANFSEMEKLLCSGPSEEHKKEEFL